jgi:hypothetical protein
VNKKWILLPVEFRGIWYNPRFGSFDVYLRDRFNTTLPPDRLNEHLKRFHPELCRREHDHAEPTWVSKEEFEEEFGRVEAVLVNQERWNSNDLFTPDEEDLLIFTERYVITLDEYDGCERFKALPRDWRPLLKVKKS